MLDVVHSAVIDLDVNLLYYTTLEPFDFTALHYYQNEKIVICEPYYSGGLLLDIVEANGIPAKYKCIGIPHRFLDSYGTADEHDLALGLTVERIRKDIEDFIYD
jgi:transketolase